MDSLLGGTVTDFLPFRRENAPGAHKRIAPDSILEIRCKSTAKKGGKSLFFRLAFAGKFYIAWW